MTIRIPQARTITSPTPLDIDAIIIELYLEDYPSSREYILANISSPDKYLGSGVFGETWLLKNGSVVKLTASVPEAICVQNLFKIQESKPEKYLEYFPRIYEYGFIDDYVVFYHTSLHKYEAKDNLNVLLFPIFYYVREDLRDIPGIDSYVDWELEKELDETIPQKIEEDLGIKVWDTHENNWGVRRSTGEIIFRDLVCTLVGEEEPSQFPI